MDSFTTYSGHPDYASYLVDARKRFIAGKAATLKDVQDVYRSAAAAVRRDIVNLTTAGPLRAGHLRALATNLERRATQLNTHALQAIQKGIWLSSEAGVSGPAGVAGRMMNNVFPPYELQQLFAGINERAVMAMLSRTRADGLMLSDRVWSSVTTWRNATTRLVEDAVARGLDSRKLAREVQQYLQPGVWTAQKHEVRKRVKIPTDVSYEGMRLARTELNNAFLEGQIAANQGVPGYLGIYWRLSDAHPAPDVCDDMAGSMMNGEPGFYPKGEEPTRPHPQCMCVVVSKFEDPEAFVERLRAWQANPHSQPDIEMWYNNTGKAFLERPSQLWSIPQQTTMQQTLNKAEKEIVNRSTEKAYIIDSKGNILLQKEGGKNYVEFTLEEVELLTGNTFTHNHPRGTSFSFEDVSLATRFNAAEMRAVGAEYTHSIKPGSVGWPDFSTLTDNYNKVDSEVKNEFWDKINNNELTVDQAEKTHHHVVWSRVSKSLGLDYRRFLTELK